MQLSMLQYLHLLEYLGNVDDVQGRIKLIHHDKWCTSKPVTVSERFTECADHTVENAIQRRVFFMQLIPHTYTQSR